MWSVLQYPDSMKGEVRPEMMESCHKMLSVSLNTLAQLSVSFCHTYEAEIQPWCGRKAPPPTTLGPLCKRVDHLKTEIDKVRMCVQIVTILPSVESLSSSQRLKTNYRGPEWCPLLGGCPFYQRFCCKIDSAVMVIFRAAL